MSTRGSWDVRPDRGVRINPFNPTSVAPASHDPRSTWLTYEPFYGLTEQPFSLASDPAFFYQSRSHASTFQDMLAGIRRRERLNVLTGDIGTGKTTLCRAVLQNLDRKTFCAFVADPFASREDLLKVLLMDFGVMSLEDLTSGRLRSASRTELSYLLYDFLDTLAPLQAFAVVIIDEAQNLSLPLLEEIRILSDSGGRDRQLQVVLVGQLELRQKLKLAELRQVDQRVSVRCHLEPLSREGVAGYVAHRLAIAGGTPERVSFSPEALGEVFEASAGVPRLINRICDRALHHGSLLRVALIDREIVQTATRELDLGATESTPRPDSPAESQGTAPDSAPHDPEAFSEQVHEWLTTADAVPHQAAPVPEASSRRPAVNSVAHGGSISLPRAARLRAHGSADPPALDGVEQPLTHMEKLTRHWLRSIGLGLCAIAVLGVLHFGFTVLETSTAPVTEAPPLPPLPPQPRSSMPVAFTTPVTPERLVPAVPARGSFVIEVALFRTRERAERLVATLAEAGLQAYAAEIDLAARGIQQQVLIGPYASRADAEADLQRVHAIGGLEDARAVEKPSRDMIASARP